MQLCEHFDLEEIEMREEHIMIPESEWDEAVNDGAIFPRCPRFKKSSFEGEEQGFWSWTF